MRGGVLAVVTAALALIATQGLLSVMRPSPPRATLGVEALLADPIRWQDTRVVLLGTAGIIARNSATNAVRFEIRQDGGLVTASYEGPVTSTFEDGADVAAVGALQPDGRFVVDELLVRVPDGR